jgi:hypothetical protein
MISSKSNRRTLGEMRISGIRFSLAHFATVSGDTPQALGDFCFVQQLLRHGLSSHPVKSPTPIPGAYAEIHHSYQCIALVLYRLTN